MHQIKEGRLKIVLLTEYYLPLRDQITLKIAQEAQALSRRGHKVKIVCPQIYNFHHNSSNVYHIPAVPLPGSSGYSLSFPGFHEARRFFQDADIIHTHHPFALGKFGQKVARIYQIPLVFTYHNQYLSFNHHLPPEGTFYRKRVTNFWREFLDACQAIITSDLNKKRQLEKRPIHAPIFYIPTGIENNLINSESDIDLEKTIDQLVAVYQLAKRFTLSGD